MITSDHNNEGWDDENSKKEIMRARRQKCLRS